MKVSVVEQSKEKKKYNQIRLYFKKPRELQTKTMLSLIGSEEDIQTIKETLDTCSSGNGDTITLYISGDRLLNSKYAYQVVIDYDSIEFIDFDRLSEKKFSKVVKELI